MKDDPVLTHLTASGLPWALIGAHALAAHGLARFTADVDVLVMASDVLEATFWPSELRPRITSLRRGDDNDPLRGLVRFGPPLALDVIVGRGRLMRDAVSRARQDPVLEVPVVTALDLVCLKLEAGGPQDLADIASLLAIQRRLTGSDALRTAAIARLPELSPWAQAGWQRLAALAPP